MTTSVRLTLLTGLLLAGERTGFACSNLSAAWPWAAGVCVLLALASLGWNLRWGWPALVFLVGMVLAARTDADHARTLESHWYPLAGHGGMPTLELPVEGPVVVKRRGSGGRIADFPSHFGPVRLKVVLPLTDGGAVPRLGEIWRCSGWISRKEPKDNRFGRRIFWAKGSALSVQAAPWLTRVWTAASDICAARAGIGLGWCPQIAALNQAILLGRRNGLPPAHRKDFVMAGTIHVFAVSGLHVMLIALLLIRVQNILTVPFHIRGLVATPVLVAYVMVTGARPSAVRAAAMAGICLFAPAFGRKGDPLTAWALTALAVYGTAPLHLFDSGCMLSFTVMLGIVSWLRWVRPSLPVWARDGWRGGLCVSLAAWVAGVPLVARVFGLFTLGGLVANPVVIPLAALTVAFGMAGIISGLILPPAAALFNNVAALTTFLMARTSSLVAKLPFSTLQVTIWPWWWCVCWYAAWIALSALLIFAIRHRASTLNW